MTHVQTEGNMSGVGKSQEGICFGWQNYGGICPGGKKREGICPEGDLSVIRSYTQNIRKY